MANKNKLGLMDFVTLAKSGWTPESVNGVLDRMENLPDESEDEKEDIDAPEDNKDKDKDEDSKDSESTDSSDMLAALKEENEKLKSDLAAAQAANRGKDNSDKDSKTIDEMVDDIFKDFY